MPNAIARSPGACHKQNPDLQRHPFADLVVKVGETESPRYTQYMLVERGSFWKCGKQEEHSRCYWYWASQGLLVRTVGPIDAVQQGGP
jgi:hypothetical protein